MKKMDAEKAIVNTRELDIMEMSFEILESRYKIQELTSIINGDASQLYGITGQEESFGINLETAYTSLFSGRFLFNATQVPYAPSVLDRFLQEINEQVPAGKRQEVLGYLRKVIRTGFVEPWISMYEYAIVIPELAAVRHFLQEIFFTFETEKYVYTARKICKACDALLKDPFWDSKQEQILNERKIFLAVRNNPAHRNTRIYLE